MGQKKPNDLGLFDMHGTVWNWCQERFGAYPEGSREQPAPDEEDQEAIVDHPRPGRAMRGTAFTDHPTDVRVGLRGADAPSGREIIDGFRVARTCD